MLNPSVYLLYGTENYLIEEEIKKITNKLIPEEKRDLNVIAYDLNTTPLQIIVEEAETLPFFAEHKLIIAKNASFFTGLKPPKNIEHNLDALEEILDKPIEYSTIIFTVDSDKLDERRKIVKKIKKDGNIKLFSALAGSALNEWVLKKTKEHNVTVTNDAVDLLLNTIGPNLQLLSQEINKLSIYKGQNGVIDKEIVEQLSVRTIEQNIFTLIENIANLEMEEAFKLFYDLLKNKEEPLKMIALLARQFRLMLYAKELNRIGYSGQQIASQLGAHPYVIQLAVKQAQRLDEEQLKGIIKKLAEIDYNIKTGKMDKVLALEMFMFYVKAIVK